MPVPVPGRSGRRRAGALGLGAPHGGRPPERWERAARGSWPGAPRRSSPPAPDRAASGAGPPVAGTALRPSARGTPSCPPVCRARPLTSHPAEPPAGGQPRACPPPRGEPPPPTPVPCTRRRRGRGPRGDGPESLTVLLWRCGHVQYSAWQYQLSTKTPLPTPLTPQPARRSQDHVPSWSDMHAYL